MKLASKRQFFLQNARRLLIQIATRSTALCVIALVTLLILCGVKLVREWPMRMDMAVTVAGCGIAIAGMAFFRERRPQMALALCATVVGLYCIELGLLVDKVVRQDAAEIKGRMTVPEMHAAGFEVFPPSPWLDRVADSGSDLIPLAPASRVKTVLGSESGRYVFHETDEFGYCNPTGWSNLSPGQAIAVVGDSFVQGWSVEPEETIVARLNSRSSGHDHQFISFGVVRAGPLNSLGVVVEYLRRLKPRYVFWCYFEGNDLDDLKAESGTGLKRYLDSPDFSQDLWNRQAEIDEVLTNMFHSTLPDMLALLRSKPRRSHASVPRLMTLSEFRSRMARFLNPPKFPVEPEWVDMFSKVLGRAKDEVKSWGGQLVFVYLPEVYRYRAPRTKDYARLREEVLNCARNWDLPVVDLHHQMFALTTDPNVFFPRGESVHYNARGYERMAEILWDYLRISPP